MLRDRDDLTPQEVANLFGVRRDTVYKWIQLRKLSHIKIGGRIYVPRQAAGEMVRVIERKEEMSA